MTVNHVGSLYSDGAMGFGLGFEVIEQLGKAGRYGSPGAYGWGSAYYQRYVVDPQEQLIAVFFSQLVPAAGLDLEASTARWPTSHLSGPCRPSRPRNFRPGAAAPRNDRGLARGEPRPSRRRQPMS
jgi:CubicO group peptidase (beta-lactamase class C family)